MLPLSTIDPEKADRNPFMFVDTGFPKTAHRVLQDRCTEAKTGDKGSRRSQLKQESLFQIGKRNLIILRKLLWKNGLLVKSYDVGGSNSRTMSLEIGTGKVTIKSGGQVKNL